MLKILIIINSNDVIIDYEKLLSKIQIRHSYSKEGYTYDNASMENFNAILKKEEVNVNTYKTFDEARLAIFEVQTLFA